MPTVDGAGWSGFGHGIAAAAAGLGLSAGYGMQLTATWVGNCGTAATLLHAAASCGLATARAGSPPASELGVGPW